MKEESIQAVLSAFRFLVDDLGFSPPTVSRSAQGEYAYTAVRYGSAWMRVEIDIDWHHREASLSATLRPASGFSVPVLSRASGRLLHVRDGFTVEELAEALAPEERIPEWGPGRREHGRTLEAYARILKGPGREVLRGDAASFPRIEAVVRKGIARRDPGWVAGKPERKARPPRAPEREEPAPGEEPAPPAPPPPPPPTLPPSPLPMGRGTPLALRIAFAAVAIGVAVLGAFCILGGIDDHRRDLRLLSGGRIVAGRAVEPHAGAPKHGLPPWTEVRVDEAPFAGRPFAVHSHLPPGSRVEMLCLDSELWCASPDDVRRSLREWPFARGIVVGALLPLVPALLLAGAWWADRRRKAARMARRSPTG